MKLTDDTPEARVAILCTRCKKPKTVEPLANGRIRTRCDDCRRYTNAYVVRTKAKHGGRLPPRLGTRAGLRRRGEIRVVLSLASGNSKTGRIPVSTSSAETCPESCALFEKGCYAEEFLVGMHWRRVPEKGLSWGAFTRAVRALPAGQLWRHNQAGDLPGVGEEIDLPKLRQLVDANRGRRGFTFTHKPLRSRVNRHAVAHANRHGFTINLSADSLAQADELADLGIGPVVVVLPKDGAKTRTPAGRHVIVCPAQERDEITCSNCKLCALPNRKAIIGFRAHGQKKNEVTQLVQLRRST